MPRSPAPLPISAVTSERTAVKKVSPEAALEVREILDTPVAVDKLIVLSCASSVWKLETAMFSIPAKVTEAVVMAAVLVPAMLKTNESFVPAPPLRLSPGLKVVPFAVVPFVPIVALNVSLPAPPTKAEPESALVVSGQDHASAFLFDIKHLRVYSRRLFVAVYILCVACGS